MLTTTQIIELQNDIKNSHDYWLAGYKAFLFYSYNLCDAKDRNLISQAHEITDFLLELKGLEVIEITDDKRSSFINGFIFGVLNTLIDNVDLTSENLDNDLDANDIENIDEVDFEEFLDTDEK